jgi:hypothetical protein
MGILYDFSMPLMITFSVCAQLLAIPFYLYTGKLQKKNSRH